MPPDVPFPHIAARAAGARSLPVVLAEGLIVAAVIGWWAVSRELSEAVMPDPWTVAVTTAELFTNPEQLAHTLTSMLRVVISVIAAVLLGTLLAFLPRRIPVLDVIIFGRIQPFLNAFPSVGWAILAGIWFGPSHETIVFVEVAILTPFCLVNVAQGLRELDAETTEMAHSFTRTRRKIFFLVTIPLLMPYIVAALRIAYGVGWKIALVAELFGTESGLGFLMLRAQTLSDAATVFAACFAVVILFIAGEKLVIDPLARRVRYH
ncbi:MAG: ABC transporter permease subunit [Rhodospirillaceae bacterium]|nr:ABC transporter permease subunit [Rhodospirillaceae bacterium]MCY4311351.1 ABC transporter permease subunit [Rhodospirillaceae bacterium]